MEKRNFAVNGEIFIKYEPQDNQVYKECLRMQQEEYLKRVKEFTEFMKNVCPGAKIMHAELDMDSIPDLIYNGMESVWIFRHLHGMHYFISLNSTSEMYGFPSMEDALTIFRPLRDIIEKEPFVGRKVVVPDSDEDVYSVYELPNVIITCTFDDNQELKKVVPVPRVLPEEIEYAKGPRLVLKNPNVLIDTIYKSLD